MKLINYGGKEDIKDKIEVSNGLPWGWKWVRLGSVSEINPSKKEITHISNELEVSFIPMDAVDEVKGEITNSKIRKLGEVRKGYTYFKEGDVIFAKITPCMENGKCAIANNLKNGLGFGSTEFHVIRPQKDITSKWIWYYLRQPNLRREAIKYFTGSVGQQRVPKEFLEKLQIPLPPLAEQKRIVARIEELFAKIDEIKKLRKSTLEFAKALLPSALHEIFSKADQKGWKWVRLGEVLIHRPQYGLTAKSTREPREFRYIRISDLTEFGELKNDEPRFVDLNKEDFKKYELENDDILIARSGSVGRVYLHQDLLQKCVFASYLIRFKLNRSQILPKFFFYYGLSPSYKKFIEETLKIVAQPNINAKEYSNLRIPLPSLEEQKHIIAYLDKISEKQRELLKLFEESEKELEKIKQSILNKAFRGEL